MERNRRRSKKGMTLIERLPEDPAMKLQPRQVAVQVSLQSPQSRSAWLFIVVDAAAHGRPPPQPTTLFDKTYADST